MSFDVDLKAHLQGDSAIAALVDDRITPMLLASDTMPGLVYQIIGGVPATDLSGHDGALIQQRVQLSAWALTITGARDLAELVRVRLKTAAATFKAVPELVGQDVYEPQTKRFGVHMDFSFWYRAA